MHGRKNFFIFTSVYHEFCKIYTHVVKICYLNNQIIASFFSVFKNEFEKKKLEIKRK